MKTLREYLDDARETIDVNELIDLVDFADSWIESFHGVSFENMVITAEQLQELDNTCFNGYETVDEIRVAVTEILSK